MRDLAGFGNTAASAYQACTPPMAHLTGVRSIEYSVVHETDALSPSGTLALILRETPQPLIVVDDAVARHHKSRLRRFRSALGGRADVISLSGGEANKTLEAAMTVVSAMDRTAMLRRSSPVTAIGGGVVCDIVGFAASIYRRGIPYVRVPTTLLAQVDVSVAIKTGVNHGGFRNRLGAFWAPIVTIVDRSFLRTQSHEEVSYGLGEILKLGLIGSADLFARLASIPADWSPAWHARSGHAMAIIERAIGVMADELRDNLWEERLRRVVDFGHSFSPMVEMTTGLHHGHAVALDCLLSTCIGVNRGITDERVLQAAVEVMGLCALPTQHEAFADPHLLWASLQETMKHRDGNQHLPVPSGIGSCTFIEELQRHELKPAIRLMTKAARRPTPTFGDGAP